MYSLFFNLNSFFSFNGKTQQNLSSGLFFNVEFSVKCTHTALQSLFILRNRLNPLGSNSPFLPPRSPWQRALYFLCL